MDENRKNHETHRTSAIGAIFMYVLLACVLAAIFCWRVASTTPQGASADKSQQSESSTTEKK